MAKKKEEAKPKAYIAGPMRGIIRYNYRAFDVAAVAVAQRGFDPISPAEEDRKTGFDPDKLPVTHDWHSYPDEMNPRDIQARCIAGLNQCQAIFLLPGWERSSGARAEKAYAEWRGLDVYYPTSSVTWTKDGEDVLLEAYRITRGDRQAEYGPPDQDFARTAQMWTAIKGVAFEARDVALFMIALKISRETHQRKRDNAVDIAGYARCLDVCNTEAAKKQLTASGNVTVSVPVSF